MGFLFLLLGAAAASGLVIPELMGQTDGDNAPADEQSDDLAATTDLSSFFDDLITLTNEGSADGGEGDDTIVAETNDDEDDYTNEDVVYSFDISGGNGNDDITLDGAAEQDGLDSTNTVDAGADDDTVELKGDFGSHVDELDLGAGDDSVTLGYGSVVESLTLGAGADEVVMGDIATEATIEDFDPEEDVLVFDLGLTHITEDNIDDFLGFKEDDDGLMVTVTDDWSGEIYSMVYLKGLTMADVPALTFAYA